MKVDLYGGMTVTRVSHDGDEDGPGFVSLVLEGCVSAGRTLTFNRPPALMLDLFTSLHVAQSRIKELEAEIAQTKGAGGLEEAASSADDEPSPSSGMRAF